MSNPIRYGAIETTLVRTDGTTETVVEKIHDYVGARVVRYTMSSIVSDKNAALAAMLSLLDEFDNDTVTSIEFHADRPTPASKYRTSATWTIRDLQ